MAIRVTTDIFCDFCYNWIHGKVSWKEERRLARAESKDAGWRLFKYEGRKWCDMCPACQRQELDTGVTPQPTTFTVEDQ